MVLIEVLAIVIVTIIIAFVIHKTLFKNRLRKSVVDPVVKKILENHENYMRLLTCLNHAGRQICLDVLFTYGYPKDKAEFYKKLSYFRSQLTGGKKKILRDDQINLLFPKNKETDYNKFDITLFYQVIRNCLPNVMPPLGGWNLPKPKATDNSLSANIVRLKDLRNRLSHGNGKITDDDFEILWNELLTILKDLNYDVSEIEALKTCTLTTASRYETAFNQSQIELCFDKLEKYNEYGTQIKQCETQTKTNSEGIRGLNRRMSIYETSVQKSQNEFMRSFETLKKEIIGEDREILHANINSIYNSIADIEDKMESGFDSFSQLVRDNKPSRDDIDGTSDHSKEKGVSFFGQEQFMDEYSFTNNKQLSVQYLKSFCTEICDGNSYVLDSLVLTGCNITDQHLIEMADVIPYLKSIDISWNTAITGNGLGAISNVISNRIGRLWKLTMIGCGLQDKDVSEMSGLITRVEILDLTFNQAITSFGYKCLTMAIEKKWAFNELRELNLSDCALNDEYLISISPAFLFIKKIILDLNRGLTEYGYNKLAEILTEADNYLIEEISLCDCYIGNTKMKAIAKFLPLLKNISLYNNRSITAEGWTYVNDEVRRQGFSYLDSLVIGGTFYREDDLIALTDIMLSTKSVEIKDSEIDIDGLQYFVQKVTSTQVYNLEKVSFLFTHLTLKHLEILLPLFTTKVQLNYFQSYTPEDEQIKPFLDQLSTDYTNYLFKFCEADLIWKKDQPKYLANMIPKLHCINLNASFNLSEHAAECIKNAVLENYYRSPDSLYFNYSNSNESFLTVISDIGKYFQKVEVDSNRFVTSHLNQLVESVCRDKLYILRELSLRNCNLNDKHVENLVKIIPTLYKLDLSENTEITRYGLNAIANVIASTSPNRFEYLELRECNFSFSDLQPLFQSKIKLDTLNVELNRSLETNVAFLEPTDFNLNLKELNISECNLRYLIFPNNCQILSSVRCLILNNNRRMHISSLRALCSEILNSTGGILEELAMRGCTLTDEHIEVLSDALSIVKTVDLSNNRAITAQGWTSLWSSLQNAEKQLLETLIIEENTLEGPSLSVIFNVAMALSELTLNNSKLIQPKDFENLTANLHGRQRRKGLRLNLSLCNLGNDHLKYLAPAVPFIKSLNLTENRAINMDGLNYLKDACCSAKYCLTDEIFIDSSTIDQSFCMTMVLPDKFWWWKLTQNIPILDLPDMPTLPMCIVTDQFCSDGELKQFMNILSWVDTIEFPDAITGKVAIIAEAVTLENNNISKGGSLSFSDSQLSDKDLISLATFAKHLRTLKISGNWLHLDSFKELTQSLQVDRCVIEELVLQNCKLTDDHLKVLEGLISVAKIMDLSGNKFITPSAWKQFADTYCTKDGEKLENLSLEDCNLTERHIESLMGLIRNLESLSIRNNYTLTSTAYSYLSNIFQTDDCCLENMDIRQIRMTDFHLKRAASVLIHLRSLDLSEVYGFTSSGYKGLSSCLKSSRVNYLHECNLSNAHITDEDMAYIGELSQWFGKIDLSENKQITARGFKAFAEAFDKTTVETGVMLKTLLLQDCSLTIFSLGHFDNLISHLTNLHLDSNKNIPLTCLQKISSTLSSCQCCLRYLSLKECRITRKHLEALGEGIVLLRHVVLSSNIFTVEDCEFLSNLICTSYPKQISKLNLDNCGIGDMHIEVMSEVIANLRYVSLSDNPSMTPNGLSKLSDKFVMYQNIVLEKLWLDDCHLTAHHLMALKDAIPKIKNIVLKEVYRPDALVGIPAAVAAKESSDDLILEEIEFGDIGDAVIEDLLPLVRQLKRLDMSSWSKTFSLSSFDSLAIKISQTSMMTLESLTLSGCFLVEDMVLSLSKFAYKLKKLDMSNCQTLSPQMMKILSESYALAKERRLESLILRNINLKKTHIDASWEWLLQMKELDISENRTISPECFSIISEQMESSKVKINIQKLVVNQCNLKEEHLKELSMVATRIKFISLNQNKMMSYAGLKCFASYISQSTVTCLERLSFCGSRLADRHVQSISEMVPFLKEIDLSDNKALQKRGLKYISNVLEKSNESKMEKIKLEQCNLNSENLEALQGVINNVKHLSLKYNYNWKVADITNLVKMISEAPNRSLQVLDLTQCNLKDSHLIALCEVVAYLKELIINKNRSFTKIGFDALSSAIANSKHLEKLSIAKCHLNDTHFTSIAKAVPYLKEIDMSKNPLLTVCGLKEITQSISDVDDNKLEVIHLRDCNLNDDCLLEIIRISVTLKKLIISRNRNLSNENFEHFLDDYKQTWNSNDKPDEKLNLDVTDSFIKKSFLKNNRWKDCVNIIADTCKETEE